MNRIWSSACLVAYVVLSVSLAQAVKLEYKVKVGDKWNQKITFKGSGTGEAMGGKYEVTTDITSTISNAIATANEDGSFVYPADYKTDTISVLLNGAPVTVDPTPSAKPLTLTLGKLGRLLKVEGLEGSIRLMNCDIGKLVCLFPAQFPDKEVNAGDTWTATLDTVGLSVEVDGKLVSVDTVEGKEVAKVECSFKLTGEALGKLLPLASGIPDVACTGKGATWTTTTEVDTGTGLPRSIKGLCALDATFTVNGAQIPFVMKTTYETETVK